MSVFENSKPNKTPQLYEQVLARNLELAILAENQAREITALKSGAAIILPASVSETLELMCAEMEAGRRSFLCTAIEKHLAKLVPPGEPATKAHILSAWVLSIKRFVDGSADDEVEEWE